MTSQSPWSSFDMTSPNSLVDEQEILVVCNGHHYYGMFRFIDDKGFIYIDIEGNSVGLHGNSLVYTIGIHGKLHLALHKLMDM